MISCYNNCSAEYAKRKYSVLFFCLIKYCVNYTRGNAWEMSCFGIKLIFWRICRCKTIWKMVRPQYTPQQGVFLTPLDFFLWSYLNSKVYATSQESLDEIERRIQRDMDNLRQNRPMVHRAVFGIIRTARLCVDRNVAFYASPWLKSISNFVYYKVWKYIFQMKKTLFYKTIVYTIVSMFP